jgi:bifunctional DNA-binding transcriptional regulator/antitoxin component of YhaV-PrlF toxin-antitoxin module
MNSKLKTMVFWGLKVVSKNEDCSTSNLVDEHYKRNLRLHCNSENVLYVYKGHIRCHKNNHNLISATAIVRNKYDEEVTLNVEYCKDCHKLLLDYNSFDEYRDRYKILIGNFRLVTNDNFDGQYILAQESPLHLSNYNVGQKDNLKEFERHYILARIIYDRIMEKYEVIDYLRFFIERNGAKKGNELALSKWQTDLRFVQEYNKNIQPKFAVKEVKKYK